MDIIIAFIGFVFFIGFLIQASTYTMRKKIEQMEIDIKNLTKYTEDMRKRINANKKVPPKFPNERIG